MKTNIFKKYRKYFVLTLLFSLNICIKFTPNGITIDMKQTYANVAVDSGSAWLNQFLMNYLNYPGTYLYMGNGDWSYCPDCAWYIQLEEVICYGTKPNNTPVNTSISDLWYSIPTNNLPHWSYWDYSGGGSWQPVITPQYTIMGDPIDPITGLANVTDRFNEKIEQALFHFCGSTYNFQNQIDSNGDPIGIIFYPVEYVNYMMNFVNDVKSGSPWDLKYAGHGYSARELGGKDEAFYNGDKLRKDDFGNITFGIAAAAYGMPLEFAQTGAGFYQILSGTSSWSYMSSYWDDARDSAMIEYGYEIYYSKGGCAGIIL